MNDKQRDNDRTPNVSACILGWICPGFGQITLGQKRRGFLIMFGVLFLVLCGVLIGGIDAVDHKKDFLWFIAQVWCGPIVLLIDFLNQWLIAPLPIPEKATFVGLSHANELGILFIAMAGLMNFVAMLDALQSGNKSDLERRTVRGQSTT